MNEPRPVRGSVFAALRNSARATPAANWLLGVGLGVLYAAALALAQRTGVQSDETYHYAQIHLFLRGDFRFLWPYLTTIPGYHAAVAALLWLSGGDSLGAARLVNGAFGLLAALAFHRIRLRLWPGSETLATAQLLALPILAPLFFLAYTDVLALALLLWALDLALRQRHGWAALTLLALLLVRQHEIVWSGFIVALSAWPRWCEDRRAALREGLTTYWPYAIPVAAFVTFWAWNGTISLSHEQAQLHPLTFRLGNPAFALIVCGVLLALPLLAALGDFFRAARAQPSLFAVPLVAAALFWWGFHVDNPYNLVAPEVYPRNALLLHLDRLVAWRAAGTVVVALTVAALCTVRLRPRGAGWLYAFAFLALGASWMIDQRYAMVPLVLWLAVREQRRPTLELATFALWLPAAVYVSLVVIEGRLSP